LGVGDETPWAVDCLSYVGYVSVAPSPDLVAEDPKPSCPARTDGAAGDDVALRAVAGADRGHLDYEPSIGNSDLDRGVVEVIAVPPLEPGEERLVHDAVQTYGVTARAKRQPVEIDPGDTGRGAVILNGCARWGGLAACS
jgi:hypothetical protein